LPAAAAKPRQLTSGARGSGKTHGLAEFIAQEEMHRFSMATGGRRTANRLAFAEVDESHIPVYRIVHQGQDAVGDGAQEDHRYPFAGKANAKVRLGVVSLAGGEPVWMDLGADEDIYLARVKWLPNGRLTAQLQNRAQSRLDLVSFDPASGQGQILLSETSEVWINLHDMLHPLKDGRFIWASERSGFRHLYLVGADGELERPLTGGGWQVDSLDGVDEANKRVYFSGTLHGPTERHLYVVDFDGGAPRRLTQEPGSHNVTLDHTFTRFIDQYDSLTQPPIIHLRALADGQAAHAFHPQRPAPGNIGLAAASNRHPAHAGWRGAVRRDLSPARLVWRGTVSHHRRGLRRTPRPACGQRLALHRQHAGAISGAAGFPGVHAR
jgi:dipeptidyl-peptidase 4